MSIRGVGVDTDRRRAAASVVAMALLLSIFVSIAPQARAATPQVLLGRNRIGEFQGIRGDDYLAWQQNSRRDPGQYDVYAQPIDGGEKFKVNPGGTSAANGGIEGDMLVYQQFEQSRSDIKFFDLADRQRSSPPDGVNTSQWEYWPSISGNQLLFGRLANNGTRRIVLFDLASGNADVLDKIRGSRSFLAPGQINGNWATWSRCPSDGRCDVIRYFIPVGSQETIPNPGRQQHASSIGPDGTVYFARARGACGSGVRLISYPLAGAETELWRLPSGDDVGTTHLYLDRRGGTSLYFDHYDCDQAAVSDVWEMTEQGPAELTVDLVGDGTGRVVGQGIDCETDCTESYEPGTDVTLTATPEGASTFVKWSGACSGTAPTCTVRMDDSKTVTAEFTRKPILTVTKEGSGGGSVDGQGISCGSDCTEAYNSGTEVTLTATPNANSTFAGWGGACGGTGQCSVTMSNSRSVTATFDLTPVQTVTLDVSKLGSGDGTVQGQGINCGNNCTQTYDVGTAVTLTADPDADSAFVVWGGACSGTDTTCQVTMDVSKSVTATFDLTVNRPSRASGGRLGGRATRAATTTRVSWHRPI